MNKWVCDCTWSVTTIEHVEGVTPFLIQCGRDGCGRMAQSLFYRDIHGEPTVEWRQPTYAEYKALSEAGKDHVRKGGLLDFPIVKNKS
jgi:hypothetical protein